MRRMLLGCLMMLVMLSCAYAADAPVRIMTVSDIHYLDPSLFEGSDSFLNSIAKGDGKATMYSQELLDALVAEALHQQPDLLVVTGDLTFNGERISHQTLADALRTVQEAGIPVAVIPGNHDMNSQSAVRYLQSAYMFVDNVDSAVFRTIWQGMLADEMPGPGMSGVVRVRDDVWVVLGDYSVYENGLATNGLMTPEHKTWLEGVAAAAKEAGAVLISASHQALVPHTDFMTAGFCVWYADDVLPTLMDAGCKLNLSGHMHIQHVLPKNGFTDIATGAWSVSPHRYGMVTVEVDGSLHYEAHAVCADHLPDGLADITRDFFRQVTVDKLRSQLASLELDEADTQTMLDFAADVNEAYFAGTLSEHAELANAPARKLWEDTKRLTFGAYLTGLLEEAVTDACNWSSEQ